MHHLELKSLRKQFGSFTALNDVSLSVQRGEFLVLLGPSGCGKTTLLRTIAGLERQDSGEIFQAGKEISQLSPAARDYGIVFQSYALFPNLTVGQNVAYGLTGKRDAREAFRQRVDEMLQLVGLPGTESKYPSQLSGGQQQRVALARALAIQPDLLLLDEPLSALDAIERVRLRSEICRLQRRLGITTVMVTHDQEEALSMADRIVVMKSGCIAQIGSPRAVYQFPDNDFVADFIGRGNLMEAHAIDSQTVQCEGLLLECNQSLVAGKKYRFNVRPEDIQLHDTLDKSGNSFFATVEKCEFLGAHTLVTLRSSGAPLQPLTAQFSSNYLAGRPIDVGSLVCIGIPPQHLHPMPESV